MVGWMEGGKERNFKGITFREEEKQCKCMEVGIRWVMRWFGLIMSS